MDDKQLDLHFRTLIIPPVTVMNHSILRGLDETYRVLDRQFTAQIDKLHDDIDAISEVEVNTINEILLYTSVAVSLLNLVLLVAYACYHHGVFERLKHQRRTPPKRSLPPHEPHFELVPPLKKPRCESQEDDEEEHDLEHPSVVDDTELVSLGPLFAHLQTFFLEKSAILSGKGPEYLRDLLGFLQPVQQSPKSRWVRCFSAKRDGWAARTFHEKCNGKAPNIVLVSVGGRYVFGGYSDVAWTMSGGGYQSSTKSFLFTLCNKNGYRPEKLPLRRAPDEYAICDDTRYGPMFGGFDLCIAGNAGGNKVSCTEPHKYARPQGAPSDGKCDVFAGTWKFTPDEMEVFHEVVD
ncbi:predicted protein [Nematostella vectensis]|uniref:TLDc domain-containing protein n=1 Tax=Nematostella vectensis TaxID=45351 RepID=A8DUV5_NEMVE|nr:predicted protein [Nematostella vectensis]|eukprot:XP_001619629.1 hypothetical protein NEMVEDRAFT_v1g248843 [Nematostella vectensis]